MSVAVCSCARVHRSILQGTERRGPAPRQRGGRGATGLRPKAGEVPCRAAGRGLHSFHFSAHRKRFEWDRGYT